MDMRVNVWDGDIDVVLHSNQVIAGNEVTTINCLCQSLNLGLG